MLYDYIVLTDLDPRNRTRGETPELMRVGLFLGGFKEDQLEIVAESKALDYLYSKAQEGDLLVINPDKHEPIIGRVLERYQQINTEYYAKVPEKI